MNPADLDELRTRLDRLERENQSLRAGIERLELAQHETGIGFYDWDLINDSAELSEEWLKIYGLPADTGKLTFKDWLKFLHPNDRDRAGEKAIKSVMAGARYEDEFRIVWPDGSVHWVRNGGKIVLDADGRVSRFIGTAIDVTERRHAETSLATAHQRLDALMRALPVGVSFSDDLSCQHVTGNPAVLTQFECGPDDNLSASSTDERVAGRQFRIFKDGRQIRSDEFPLQMAVATDREVPPVELEFLLPSGRRWYAESSGAPIRDAQGNLIGGLAVTLDITRRKQAERALAQSQKQNEFLAKLIRDSSQPVAVAYENGAIGLVNRAFEELTGYSGEELRALGRARLTPPDHHAHERIKLDEMRRTGHPVRYEKEYLRKDGTRVPVELLVHIVPATTEEAEYYYTFVNDITERKQERAQLEAELARVARALTLGELTASIAHEINQPLAAVVTNANACVRWLNAPTPNLDEAKAAAQRMGRDANRAADVITRIRALLTKGDSLRQRLVVNDVINELTPLIDTELRRRDAKLVFSLENNIAPALMDKIQIQQLLMNLLMNALDAMADIEDRSRIVRINTASQEAGVLVSIQDTGKGLEKEQMGKLFDAFYTTKPHGLGIGLSISRSIAESHGGRLWATSEPGSGATFYLTLPIHTDEVV